MAIEEPTVRLLRRLMVDIGGEADTVTRSLTKSWTRSWDELAGAWRRAMQDVTAKAAATGTWPSAWELGRMERLGKAVADSETALAQLGKQVGVTVTDAAGRVVATDADYEPRLVSSQVPAAEAAALATLYSARVTPSALDVIVARTQGQITSALLPLSDDATEAMKRTLIQGIAVGQNPTVAASQMVARVEGAFNGGLTRAINVARTEMLDAYRTSSRYSHAANADVVAGWVWISTLDNRVCPACWSMHGRVFPVGTPGPMDHQQGRCARAPKTKSWAELGFNVKEPADTITNAQAKFKSLSADAQRSIMGPGRLNLLNSGKVGWNDLAGLKANPGWRQSYVPRSVTELERIAKGRTPALALPDAVPLPRSLTSLIPAPSGPGPAALTPGAVARATLTVRQALLDVDSVAGVNRVFSLEAKRITGRTVYSYLDGHVDTAREHAEGVLRGLEAFPEANLKTIRMSSKVVGGDLPTASYAEASWDEISFSRYWSGVTHRDDYLQALADDVAGWNRTRIVDGKNVTNGFHPRNTGNAISIAIHEFGHTVDIATTAERVRPAVNDLIKKWAQSYGPLAQRDIAAGLTAEDLVVYRSVSRYAARNGRELMAEAFSDVMANGDAASLLSRQIFDLLKAEYLRDGLKLGIRAVARTAPDLSKFTVPQLRAMAKDLGLKGLSKARKADIIAVLNATNAERHLPPTPKAAPKTSAATVADGDFKGLKRVGPQGGSNPGGIFEADDGSRWYIKASTSEQWANEQALASELYRLMGIETPEIVVGRGVAELGRGFQTATRMIDDVSDVGTRDRAFITKAREGFAADAWLADWDVGQHGNILSRAGVPVRMDIGGSLRFRARGGSKSTAFGTDVGEWLTLRDARNVSGFLFKDITLAQLKKSVKLVERITPDQIKALVRQHHLGPELSNLLIARRADILRRLADDIAASQPRTIVPGANHITTADHGKHFADEATRIARTITNDSVADPFLSAVARLQGFEEKPTVVTQAALTKMIREGHAHPIIYRGVTDSHSGWSTRQTGRGVRKTAAQIQEDMRTGDAYFGLGVYGNGYYFSTQRATSVAYSQHTTGSVVRATIRADAKTVDSDTLYREWQAWRVQHARSGNPDQIYSDVGRYAAAKGYDVIIKNQGAGWSSQGAEKYYIVLNRSVLIVQKAAATRAASA